jgi:hypothetical protein
LKIKNTATMKALKKIYILVLMVALSAAFNIQAQVDLEIPEGRPATIDGTVYSNEWGDAAKVTLPTGIPLADEVDVYLKHANETLYICYVGDFEQGNPKFPEICLDPDWDQSPSWQADDWWFHISATDCDFQGDYSNFQNCDTVQSDWNAAPNISPGPPSTAAIEMYIPFSKISPALTVQDTVGLRLQMGTIAGPAEFWPEASFLGDPSTWATAIFQQNVTGIEEIQWGKNFQIYPNPTRNIVNLRWDPSIDQLQHIIVRDLSGRQVEYSTVSAGVNQKQLNLQLPSGVYFLELNGARYQTVKRIIVTQ